MRCGMEEAAALWGCRIFGWGRSPTHRSPFDSAQRRRSGLSTVAPPALWPSSSIWFSGPRLAVQSTGRGEPGMGSVIIKDPEILGGEPVFRGTRVPFKILIEYLEGGDTLDQFLEQYPSVSRELAVAAIEEARLSLVSQLK